MLAAKVYRSVLLPYNGQTKGETARRRASWLHLLNKEGHATCGRAQLLQEIPLPYAASALYWVQDLGTQSC